MSFTVNYSPLFLTIFPNKKPPPFHFSCNPKTLAFKSHSFQPLLASRRIPNYPQVSAPFLQIQYICSRLLNPEFEMLIRGLIILWMALATGAVRSLRSSMTMKKMTMKRKKIGAWICQLDLFKTYLERFLNEQGKPLDRFCLSSSLGIWQVSFNRFYIPFFSLCNL